MADIGELCVTMTAVWVVIYNDDTGVIMATLRLPLIPLSHHADGIRLYQPHVV